jgi:glycosyltransferase involved in cell wall biosynthesis
MKEQHKYQCEGGSASKLTLHDLTSIAQSALADWNSYLTSGDRKHEEAFMTQAYWFLSYVSYFADDTSGWPIWSTLPGQNEPQLALSALAQGYGLSVLIRAYQLTREDEFLQVARRVVHTLELDILDGGVCAPMGENGVFFETVAVYPATHVLSGHILALFGLYDYASITGERHIEVLIQRGLASLHSLITEFDAGFWTYYNLYPKRLTSRLDHSLHVQLLNTLAEYTNCTDYLTLATRWQHYQDQVVCRLRYLFTCHITNYYDYKLKPLLQRIVYGKLPVLHRASLEPVCVPVRAFPASGGVTSVLTEVGEAMENLWRITYFTNREGQVTQGQDIKVFGHRKFTSPWQFPNVWLYCFSGARALFRLLRDGSSSRLLLPQDGIYTSAFAACIGKLMGIRIVCMDHGSLTCLVNPAFRNEWETVIAASPWYKRTLAHLRLSCYWLSLRSLARLATSWTDHFLVAGDEVEQVYCEQLGVHPHRITRYAYNVDANRFTPPDRESRTRMRTEQNFDEDAIVITLINRLALEKGLSFAIEGIALALAKLSPQIRKRVKVLIVGEGPLRSQLEADILRYRIDDVCSLWGNAQLSEVVMLLAITDIFLYSGTRGTNYSMAVLEAMAAGCAVVASVSPLSNARLLADGRGIPIKPGDAQEISTALTHLCNDQGLCRQMGHMAREYISAYHNATMLKRTLLRVSHFAPTLVEQKKRASEYTILS